MNRNLRKRKRGVWTGLINWRIPYFKACTKTTTYFCSTLYRFYKYDPRHPPSFLLLWPLNLAHLFHLIPSLHIWAITLSTLKLLSSIPSYAAVISLSLSLLLPLLLPPALNYGVPTLYISCIQDTFLHCLYGEGRGKGVSEGEVNRIVSVSSRYFILLSLVALVGFAHRM